MHIIYNGIAMDILTLDTFEYGTVMDDSQTDVLFQRVRILCTAMVNGQSTVRTVSGPPISYINAGGSSGRNATGGPAGANIQIPSDTESSTRQLGAAENFVQDFGTTFNTNPYTGTVGVPGFNQTPVGNTSWATDDREVEIITAGPTSGTGSSIVTHQLISKRLTDARGQLFVFSGTGANPSMLLLQSPPTGCFCDAKNGPKPTIYNISHTFGDGITFFVTWGCETYIRLQNNNYNDPSYDEGPILSNRFSMTHTVNEDSFLTIDVVGRAIFDAAFFYANALNMDMWRPNLMLPIPLGFVRNNIVVRGSEDGTTIDYSFRDTQQAMNLVTAPYSYVMNVEAKHRQFIQEGGEDLLASSLSAYDSALNRRWTRKALENEKKDRRLTEEEHHIVKKLTKLLSP